MTTPDHLSRVAIVERSDCLFSLYQQSRWPEEPSWTYPLEIVDYLSIDDDQTPEFGTAWYSLTGLFGTADDAEAEARASLGYNEALTETN